MADAGLRAAECDALARHGGGRERLVDALTAMIYAPGPDADRAEDARQRRYIA